MLASVIREKRDSTWEDYNTLYGDRHLLHGNIEKWARETPDAVALVETETDREITYCYFNDVSTAIALKFLEYGFRPGDYFATALPLTPHHLFLEYACFKIGVRFAPLDLRLKGAEVVRSLDLVKPRGFAFLGPTPVADFRALGQLVQAQCPYVERLIQLSPPEETIDGAISAMSLVQEIISFVSDPTSSPQWPAYCRAHDSIRETDGALVIYTTGSTGYPKPALLSHQGITVQNMCVTRSFGLDDIKRMLVNVPPSHVACQAAQLMGCFFNGGGTYLMRIFDAEATLANIQKYKIQSLGQIPAMFAMEWRLPNFDDYDTTSLEGLYYGGQAATMPMIERMEKMCPNLGTGLGLTEMSGFATYTPPDLPPEELSRSWGVATTISPMTIRAPMNPDGSAGKELPEGEIGEICFSGPQVFLGYVNDEAATRKTISTDGYLYTGDLGCQTGGTLRYTGRSKLVIKPKGYQVYPAQIEEHFAELRVKVSACGAVGAPHDIFTEGIVLFVEKHQGVELGEDELHDHAREIAAYMRPSHFEILEPGHFPLNRVSKTDYVTLKERAINLVESLRQSGKWDRLSDAR